MKAREYRLEFGSFYFYENGRMQFMADRVGICFSILDGNGVLHRHGSVEDVQAWWETNRADYAALFGDLHIVDSNRWDPELLTACIENPSLLIQLCKQAGIACCDNDDLEGRVNA